MKTRILCQMQTADPVGTGRKSCRYSCISVQEYSCTGTTFSPYQQDQLYVFGAISSSSILHPILYITYYSMAITEPTNYLTYLYGNRSHAHMYQYFPTIFHGKWECERLPMCAEILRFDNDGCAHAPG